MSSRVLGKAVVNGFRLGSSSSKGLSTLVSESPLPLKSRQDLMITMSMLPTLLRQQLARPLLLLGGSGQGGALNSRHRCGCLGGFARMIGTTAKDSTPTAPATAQKEESEEDKPIKKTEGLQQSKLEPRSGQVFRHARHNMYVCWHSEVPFPYEMTKPIDLSAPISDSHLKVQSLLPVKEAFRRKHEKLMIQELVKLTYSTKHRFYGKFGKRRRLTWKENDPNKEKRNRPYL